MDQAAVENEDVQPAIVVKIINAAAPTYVLAGRMRDPRARTDVFESLFALRCA